MQPTLLIVDDEKHTREGLRTSLEDHFEVYIAADVAGAMRVLDNDHVDLVLTDLRLGGEDGMSLIDKILARQNELHMAQQRTVCVQQIEVVALRRRHDRHAIAAV